MRFYNVLPVPRPIRPQIADTMNHTDLIARLRALKGPARLAAADALESLEQQVAALTKEHEFACEIGADYRDKWMAAQAREAKLREALMSCRRTLVVHHPMESLGFINEALALPTDDSALMERLKDERERAVREYIEMLCHDEGYWCFVCGRFLPANEDGVIVHDNVPHPEEMTFDEEERPQ